MAGRGSQGPLGLSVVIVAYEIQHQLDRTLRSLSPVAQRDIESDDYELIVVDNGSSQPLNIDAAAANVRLVRIDDAHPSPAAAANRGLAEATGDVVCVMIDGARIASPGLLAFGVAGTRIHDRAVVASLGWILGFDYEPYAVAAGYDSAAEDALLESVGWPEGDGYRLFEVSTMDSSSTDGWVSSISESNGLFLRRELWEELRGYEERFVAPGGGLVNLDVYSRALDLPGAQSVVLLGEATFHQLHRGTATGAPPSELDEMWDGWASEYKSIRGRPYEVPKRPESPIYLGRLPTAAFDRFARAIVHPSRGKGDPLGDGFDRVRWRRGGDSRTETDPATRDLVELMNSALEAEQFTAALALARRVRARTPQQPDALRLTRLLADFIPQDRPALDAAVEFHLALAKAARAEGDEGEADLQLRTVLGLDPNNVQAHVNMAELALPGERHLQWLEWIYAFMAPSSVLEIGVEHGESLSQVPAGTLAIGVDPAPRIDRELPAGTQLFVEPSDAFFDARRLDELLKGEPLGVAFIDGLHLFEQSLRDFVHVARYCGPRSVVLIHDTLPLSEPTQDRACDTQFHTGDVWRTALAIRHLRPDLELFTIAAPWSGLTVVTGFGDSSPITAEEYDETVARFLAVSYGEFVDSRDQQLIVVPNDWDAVRPRLERIKGLARPSGRGLAGLLRRR